MQAAGAAASHSERGCQSKHAQLMGLRPSCTGVMLRISIQPVFVGLLIPGIACALCVLVGQAARGKGPRRM